ncbi:MAG: MMPL family transporter [Thermoplasmata archaeon]|nr:MMPL family transporter [Thermoplasmata archaeon]
MFEKYAQHVQKHPKTIIAIWIVALLIAVPFAIQSNDVLNYDMTSMGGFNSESSDGQALVDTYFDSSLSVDTVVAIPYESDSQKTSIESALLDSGVLTSALDAKFGQGAVTYSYMGAYSHDDSASGIMLVTIDFGDLTAMDEIGNLRDAVSSAVSASGVSMTTYVTGNTAITYDTLQSANSDTSIIHVLSILLILILLGLFFATLVTAVVPPLVVGTAYGIVLALMYALGQVFDIFYITGTIVLVSMLGAGCDYSIFIIARYREERNYGGKSKEDALTEAIMWAGESVFTSGLAVIIGFAVMSLCTYSLVSSMAIILALGIVVAMLAALTLIPAVIAIVGDRIFWPRKIEDYTGQSKMRRGGYGKMVSISRRYFGWAGKFSTKHAKAIVAVAIVLTVPLSYVALTSEDSYDMISVMPDEEARQGVYAITDSTDGGYLMPTYVLIETDEPVATVSTSSGIPTLEWTVTGALEVLELWTTVIGTSLVGGNEGSLQEADDNVSLVLGPISWELVYTMVYEIMYQQYYQGAIAQGMSETAAAAYAESNTTPTAVNQYIVYEAGLPDMLATPLETVFNTYNLWAATPDTTVIGTATLAGIIDYQINYSAGLVSISTENPDSNGMYIQLMVITADEPMSDTTMTSVSNIRSAMSDFAAENDWVAGVWVYGTVASLYDISETVTGEFHWIQAGVIVLIYILLLFVLGSYFTPIRSLATIMMSVLWTLGTVHLVYGTLMGIDVVWIVPIVLFVICLGLGMDYDILLTTRIREGRMKGLSNDEAIQNALSWSGSVITLCGLVMGGTFLTLLLSGSSMLQEIGFALGFAILVDSLIVVPYVVPALMHLMGNWSWKGPKFLTRRSGIDKVLESEAAEAEKTSQ